MCVQEEERIKAQKNQSPDSVYYVKSEKKKNFFNKPNKPFFKNKVNSQGNQGKRDSIRRGPYEEGKEALESSTDSTLKLTPSEIFL
ncbi:hypothetical protein U9M48_029207 [Paspalum notatum var. saurae]|uniref:Uncharacterized protein n=1 Tax=Paspalum notatum var. saurae TaxID=547442 RepID=A0AAQ3X1T5_PASNO